MSAILPRPRIIPARAGFTEATIIPDVYRGDHPRSRGVYLAVSAGPSQGRGSSPLARGLPAGEWLTANGRRIIPARAGFTRRRRRRPSASRDHPRSRGVYSQTLSRGPGLHGSSPLARGLRAQILWAGIQAGIIPARAGFTRRIYLHRARPPDHPRSRGVYPHRTERCAPCPGSSPLARGLPRGIRVLGWWSGIIPARAGFTRHLLYRRGRDRDHPRSRGVYAIHCRRAGR